MQNSQLLAASSDDTSLYLPKIADKNSYITTQQQQQYYQQQNGSNNFHYEDQQQQYQQSHQNQPSQMLQDMYALQNDRIGNANSSFNSLKSRFMNQRMSLQQNSNNNQNVQLNQHEISALKRIVRKNHQKNYEEQMHQQIQSSMFQSLNKSHAVHNNHNRTHSRQGTNLHQQLDQNEFTQSGKQIRANQNFRSRAESQIIQDSRSLNQTSINFNNNNFHPNTSTHQQHHQNQMKLTYLKNSKNLTKAQNTPIKHDFRIKTTQTKRTKKLRSPSVNKNGEFRFSQNEFKVPFQIYQDMSVMSSPSNKYNEFTSKSLLKSRQMLKRGNSQNDVRWASQKQQKTPRDSKSRERSINSSLSNRSQKFKLQSQNILNSSKKDKLLQQHQPKLKSLRLQALQEFQQDVKSGRLNQYQNNINGENPSNFMRIVEEQSLTNFQQNNGGDLSQRFKPESQRGKKNVQNIGKNQRPNIDSLIKQTNMQYYSQSVKNQNNNPNQSNLINLINSNQNNQAATVKNQLQQNTPLINQQHLQQQYQSLNLHSISNNQQQNYQQQPTSYKKLLEEVNTENVGLRSQMNHMTDDLSRKQTQIDKLKIKTAQAQSDKIELMRDLATYEVNFADNCGIRSILMQMHKKVQHVKKCIEVRNRMKEISIGGDKLKNSQQQSIEESQNTWLDKTKKATLFMHLSELSILKRERGSVSETQHINIFVNSPLNQASPSQFKNPQNQMFFNKNKKNQITPRDEFKGIYEEQLFQSTYISGFPCIIQANLMNGMVQAIVQTSQDHKTYKLEIKPLNNKAKISLRKEVKRLYFTIDNYQNKSSPTNKNGGGATFTRNLQPPWIKNQSQFNANNIGDEQQKQRLLLQACDSYDQDLSLQSVIQIRGSRVKFCEASISELEDNTLKEVNVKCGQKQHTININPDLNLSNKQLFEHLQTQYMFRDLKHNDQELVLISENATDLIEQQKWLRKIQLDKSLTATTIDEYDNNPTPNYNGNQQIYKDKADHSSDNDRRSSGSSSKSGSIDSKSNKMGLQNNNDNGGEDYDTPGGRNKQYIGNMQSNNISPDFLQNQLEQQPFNQFGDIKPIAMRDDGILKDLRGQLQQEDSDKNKDLEEDGSSVSEHDNDNLLQRPNRNVDDTFNNNNNEEGIFELNKEIQGFNNKISQDYKRIKSQLLDQYDDVKKHHDNLNQLNLKQIKSQSNNNLNFANLLSLQNSHLNQSQMKNQTKVLHQQNTIQELPKQLTQEDIEMQKYEFLYHYKWFANNRQYYLIAKAKKDELERIKKIEAEERKRLRQEEERRHDELQLEVIRSQLEKYRDYFKGPQSIALVKSPMMHQTELEIDEKTRLTFYVFPLEQEDGTKDLQILINKFTQGENGARDRASRRSSAMRINSFESIIISKRFLDSLGLHKFKNLEKITKKWDEFLKSEGFVEIVKHHIQMCLIEKELLSKTFDQHQAMSQLQVHHGIRKMESELKNSISVTVRGYEKTSSDFGDTSINNDSYSKYLK
eukprot:403345159